jgi:hypothetical protein
VFVGRKVINLSIYFVLNFVDGENDSYLPAAGVGGITDELHRGWERADDERLPSAEATQCD